MSCAVDPVVEEVYRNASNYLEQGILELLLILKSV
jgi:hypothetical protein